MAIVSDEVRTHIVQALACFDSPQTVAESVKEEFKVEVTRQYVESHDPTKRAGRTLGKKWAAIFNATREKFRNEIADIPIANRAVRLRKLDRFAYKAENMRNLPLAMQAIEQAAKECGDMFINRQKATEKDPEETLPTRIEVHVQDARKRPRESDADA